ncbi:M23 family metallopeptidase [Patescibacteria group bacterium]
MSFSNLYYQYQKFKFEDNSWLKKLLRLIFFSKDVGFLVNSFTIFIFLLIGCLAVPKYLSTSLVFSQYKTTNTYAQNSEKIEKTGFSNALAIATSFNLPITGPISQGFSWHHPAIDIVAKISTPIYPIGSGKVAEVDYYSGSYGNKVVIFHGNDTYSFYAHLGKTQVQPDQFIHEKTILGTIGVTGRTTGPHLHLEIIKNGKPVNPLTFIKQQGYI